ncbi:hypothetical protein B0A52_09597 [Exophiala mesophila]|uniref:Uncharacterized protein n=1 Tax=Exophiala mesophila TaxID=212818 RepID=A0A438MT78_EXOME|nr:hypothetical protein B0A52_09597 [Exophiala mesophila]
MATNFYPSSVEPFPLFIDSAPPNSANYFSSPIAMAAIQLLAAKSPHPPNRSRLSISIPPRITNYVRLRYYQYEVTFGLYMLTPREKLIFNTMLLSILTAILYTLCWGLQDFLVSCLCKLIYYVYGSLSNAPEICSQQGLTNLNAT